MRAIRAPHALRQVYMRPDQPDSRPVQAVQVPKVPKLSLKTFGHLPYPATAAGIGVVHLGVGNFFRAHQAIYLDDAMKAGETGWGICGVSLRSPATRDALTPQDGLYTLIEREAGGASARVCAALRTVLVAPESPERVITQIAAPGTRWVTLTITEKGYCHRHRADGVAELDYDHPDIRHDLANPDQARSVVGLLHAGLARRHRRGLAALTVLSCDNLSGNGALLNRLIGDFDAALERATPAATRGSGWIEDQARFPDTMIDRIVPRTTDAHRQLARDLTGLDDAWPVVTEPYRQWVIANDFAGPRPDLARHGVQIVPDVRPYEAMKLRLLNAAHTAIACLSLPAGIETVDRAVTTPALRSWVDALWREEVIPGLDPTIRALAPDYCRALMARFENPGLAHRTAQIAMDGSQKLPLRILPSIRANLALGLPIARLTLVVAAWIRYLGGVDETGRAFVAEDPLAERLRAGAAQPNATAAAKATISHAGIFGDLADHQAFAAMTGHWLERLRREGTIRTVS